MCMGGGSSSTPKPRESVKQVATVERRSSGVSYLAEQAAVSETNPSGRGVGGILTQANTQKKSLLGK